MKGTATCQSRRPWLTQIFTVTTVEELIRILTTPTTREQFAKLCFDQLDAELVNSIFRELNKLIPDPDYDDENEDEGVHQQEAEANMRVDKEADKEAHHEHASSSASLSTLMFTSASNCPFGTGRVSSFCGRMQ